MRKLPVKTVRTNNQALKNRLSCFPNAGPNPNITGMRRIREVTMFNKEEKKEWISEFLERLRDFPDGEIWSNGYEILCKSEEVAETISDLLTQLYRSQDEEVTPVTGYYDPEEDKRNDEEDYCTGWYYVTLD